MSARDTDRCSDVIVEPLPGSAKQESVYVVLEHPGGWSHDILDGDTFGEELTARLKDFLKRNGAGLQLVRHPGRDGHRITRPRLFVVWAALGVTEMMVVDGPEDIVRLDLSAPGRNDDLGAQEIDQPLILVCTHGKRDVCCAIKGRPLAATLADAALDVSPIPIVWETSHTKGHRFAPSILLLPWGYSYGRLNEEASLAMLNAVRSGFYFWPGNRGRGLYGPRGQVAELAIARLLLAEGERLRFGELQAEDGLVTHSDGRRWRVELSEQEVHGVVASCGKPPKDGTVWVASGVAELG